MYLPRVQSYSYVNQLNKITSNAAALYERALSEPMTERDLALAVEYNQQYLELLSELEVAPLPITIDMEVETENHVIKFKDEDGLAEWLSETME